MVGPVIHYARRRCPGPAGGVQATRSSAATTPIERITVSPPCGAGWFSVTVPVVDTPLPTIVYGLRLYLVIVIGRLPVNSTPLRFVVVSVTDCGAKPKVLPWAVVV